MDIDEIKSLNEDLIKARETFNDLQAKMDAILRPSMSRKLSQFYPKVGYYLGSFEGIKDGKVVYSITTKFATIPFEIKLEDLETNLKIPVLRSTNPQKFDKVIKNL